MMRAVTAISGVVVLPALLSACQTTHMEVGNGLFACDTGRMLKVREEGARRIVALDDGPEIVLSPMPRRRHLWWTAGNEYSLQIKRDVATWMVRDGHNVRRDRCAREAGPAWPDEPETGR